MPIKTEVDDRRNNIEDLRQHLFGDASWESIARAAGSPEGSTVHFYTLPGMTSTLELAINHPEFHAVRLFNKQIDHKGNSRLVMHAALQTAEPSFRGNGYKRFAAQIPLLQNLGVSHIELDGEGPDRNKESNGHYTWPRFGFNGQIPIRALGKLSPETKTILAHKGKADFHTLFSIPGAAEEWRKLGHSADYLNFDLNPNSEHIKRFNEYYNQRKARESEPDSEVVGTKDVGGSTERHQLSNSTNSRTGNSEAENAAQLERRLARHITPLKKNYSRNRNLMQVERYGAGSWLSRIKSRFSGLFKSKKSTTAPIPVTAPEAATESKPVEAPTVVSTSEATGSSELPTKVPGREGEWTPKYPSFAVSPETGLYTEEPHPGPQGFENAPEPSHVQGFKLQDGGFIRKFYAPSVGAPEKTRTVITVKFKGRNNKGHTPEYEYYFTNEDEADSYMNALRNADHPGHVVNELIANGVPYKRKYSRSGVSEKYAAEDDVEVHPWIKGFRLEHVLKHLLVENGRHSDIGGLALTSLQRPEAIPILADALEENEHPLAQKFNWRQIPHKLALDAAVGHAINTVSKSSAEHPDHVLRMMSNVHFGDIDPAPLFELEHLRAPTTEALNIIKNTSGASREDIDSSLLRHEDKRFDDLFRDSHFYDPKYREKEAVKATMPHDRYNAEKYESEPEVHPWIKGFRIEHVLKHLVTNDPHMTVDTQNLARASLQHPELLPDLADKLEEHDHPLAHKFNWRQMPYKMHLDNAVGQAINTIASRDDSYNPNDAYMRAAYTLHNVHQGGHYIPPHRQHLLPITNEIYPELIKSTGANHQELEDSIQRHEDKANLGEYLSDPNLGSNSREYRTQKVVENAVHGGDKSLARSSKYSRLKSAAIKYARYNASKYNFTQLNKALYLLGTNLAQAIKSPGPERRHLVRTLIKHPQFYRISNDMKAYHHSLDPSEEVREVYPDAAPEHAFETYWTFARDLHNKGLISPVHFDQLAEQAKALRKIPVKVDPPIEVATKKLDTSSDKPVAFKNKSIPERYVFLDQHYSDDSGEWSVKDLHDYIQNNKVPISKIKISDLQNNLDENPNQEPIADEIPGSPEFVERANKADLKYPIMAVKYNDGICICDGVHRLYKAKSLGHDFINVHLLTKPQLDTIPKSSKSSEKFTRPRFGDFISALRRVRSQQQDSLRQIAQTIHKKLKLGTLSIRDAVHDTPVAASANTAQSIEHSSPEQAQYAAAQYGLLTQSPSLLVFHVGDGPDSVYKIHATGSGDKLRSLLDKSGLPQRTLLPTKTGYDVLLYDRGSQLQDKVQNFADSIGSNIALNRGHGHIIGSSDESVADSKTRKSYRSIINKYERELSASTSTTNNSSDQRPGSTASTGTNQTTNSGISDFRNSPTANAGTSSTTPTISTSSTDSGQYHSIQL